MKSRIIALLLAVTCVLAAAARNPEKDYRKLIERLDVADTVMNAPSAAAFWQLLQDTDPRYSKVARSMASEKSNRDIKRNMIRTMAECDDYFLNVPSDPSLYGFAEQVMNSSGLRAVSPTAILSVTRESDIAAFSYPNGYFFITRPLYDALGGNPAAITAVIAAQGAHFVLQHAYDHACHEKSRRHRSRVARFFGAIAVAITGAVLDCATDWQYPFSEMASIVAMTMVAYDSAPRYTMLYTPDQIHQADIIAYRFMEWTGAGGRSYIDALRRVGYDIDAANGSVAEAPPLDRRIALLEYLDSHPEIRGRVKARNRRPERTIREPFIFLQQNYR